MPGVPKNPLVARAFSHNLTHDTTRDLRIFRDIDGFSHKVSHQLKANLHQSTQLWLLQALPGLGGRESLVAAVWAWSGKHPACVWLLCSIQASELQGGAAASLLRCALFCCVEVLQIVPLLMDIQVSLIWRGQCPAGALAPQREARPAQEQRGRGGAACLLPSPRGRSTSADSGARLPGLGLEGVWTRRQVQARSGARTRGWQLREPCWTSDGKLQPCSQEPEPAALCRGRRPPHHVRWHQAPRCRGRLCRGLQGVSALSQRTLRLQHCRQTVPAWEEHSPDAEPFPEHRELKHGFQSHTAKSPLGRFGS